MNTQITHTDNEIEIGKRVKEHLEKLKETITKELKEVVWTACNDYVEWADYEPLNNWKDRERDQLIREERYWSDKTSYWGKTMRATIFEEHKDVILPMIKDEQIEKMMKEIEQLKERLKFEVDLNRSRY